MLKDRFVATFFVTLVAMVFQSCNKKEYTAPNVEGNWVLYRTNDRILDGYRGISLSRRAIYSVTGVGPTRIGDYCIKRDSLIISSDQGKDSFIKSINRTTIHLYFLTVNLKKYIIVKGWTLIRPCV